MPKGTPQGRVKNLGARLVYASMLTIVFIFGTAGVFLAFNWPPLLREIVLGYLSVAIVTGAATMVTRVFLLPPSLRVPRCTRDSRLPDDRRRAPSHWHRWIGINVFWLMFVVVTFAADGHVRLRQDRPLRHVDPDQLHPARADPACGLAAAARPGCASGCSAARRHRSQAAGRGCSASTSSWSGSCRLPAPGCCTGCVIAALVAAGGDRRRAQGRELRPESSRSRDGCQAGRAGDDRGHRPRHPHDADHCGRGVACPRMGASTSPA